jgi:hypothetical protein
MYEARGSSQVFISEVQVCMSAPTRPAPKAAGYQRWVLERWGHSTCNVIHRATHHACGTSRHALRDLGTLGSNV